MMRKGLFLLLFLAVSLACAVLAPTEQDAERPLSTVFDNMVCEPPCWKNIVPGVSTYEQTLEILKTISITENQLHESAMGMDTVTKTIFYKVYNSKTNKFTEWVEIIFTASDIVERIHFTSASDKITLPYVISRFGEPKDAILGYWGPRPGLLIMGYPERGIEVRCLPNCSIESEMHVVFYAPEDYQNQLIREYGSLEKAEYAKRFFCPWVGVDAEYLSVDWGAFRDPSTPTASPEEIASRCPKGK